MWPTRIDSILPAGGGVTILATFSEPQWEHSVEASGCIVLGCQECAEAIVLLGLEEDWHEEGKDTFSCECGESLTIASNSVDESAFSVRQLLRRPGHALNGVRRNPNGA
jgi:hypothetical protein